MMRGSARPRNFFRKLVVNGVNNSKAAIQNDCLMRLYDADAELKAISSELDSFDGKKDPIRCNLLVNQLRTAQDKVISLLFQLMDDCNCERASRDYRMKFPDEILLSEGSESLNGQIWFGAECLSAGSNILNHTKESTMLRPMAKTLTTHLDSLRNDLRDLVIDGGGASRISPALIKKMVAFDHIFATFEYEYVRTMLPIRTVAEIEKLQEVAVLFSETLIDCVKRGLVKQEDIDEFQPIVMIAIPRLAIVRGLLYKNENPIYTRHKSQMCSLFQPFHGPLHSIRKLLRGLSPQELFTLEKMLANDQSASENPMERPNSSDKANNVQNAMESSEVTDQQREVCENVDEPGTSSNYSNVLMDGLQYPVGKKRSIEEPCPAYQLNQDENQLSEPTYNCYFDTQASSSKSVAAPTNSQENSPVGSSSSPSSSLSSRGGDCKNCVAKVEKSSAQSNEQGCDNECCTSPPESDAQLEKLIAEFGPSMDCRVSIEHDSPSTIAEPSEDTVTTTNGITRDEDQDEKLSTVKASSKDSVLLEELFVKQAQQLLHRLFVAISGVADQLQSNFASDLRFILRHIFSTENDNDEDESEHVDESSNEESDSSLPIEQGIEAQEVANLIDLESGYPVESTYEYGQDLRFIPHASSNHNYLHQADNSDYSRYSPNSSYFLSQSISHHRPNSSDNNARTSRNAIDQDLSEDAMSGLIRTSNPNELIYESMASPNDPSIMDDESHRQLLMQQHLQSLSRAARTSSRSQRHAQINEDGAPSQQSVERRSRHHHRSRRSRGQPPVWVPDQLVVACSCCNASFTLFRRRHHCRACGQIFCAECSKFTKNLNCWGYSGPVRVCESCYNQP